MKSLITRAVRLPRSRLAETPRWPQIFQLTNMPELSLTHMRSFRACPAANSMPISDSLCSPCSATNPRNIPG